MTIESDPLPSGKPAIQTLAMPADTNPSGDIFGGWLMSQMDLACGVVAGGRANGRVATIAVDSVEFHKPVYVGDLVSCYADIVRVGRTSIVVRVETYAKRGRVRETVKVTEATFVFVAIDRNGRPRPVPPVEESTWH